MTDEELIVDSNLVERIVALLTHIERLETAIRSRIHWIDGEDHCDCGECEALFSALKGGWYGMATDRDCT